MIIKEIYIENFGKLSSFRKEFDEGFNTVCADNGFGKTTLTAFIKAMLYGLDENKKSSVLENERKRYTPWQGGAFGGYMIFESRGKVYRIERSFGKKPSEDTFALYDVSRGLSSDELSATPGTDLFGIDADGFERTVFLSERNLFGKNENQTIAAKLSDLVGVAGDVGDFDKAIDILDDRRKVYRLMGGRGIIKDAENERSRLEAELAEAERIVGEEDGILLCEKNEKARAEEFRKKREELLKKRDEANAVRLKITKLEALWVLKRELADEEEKLGKYRRIFEKKQPTATEIDDLLAKSAELRRLRELRDSGTYKEEPAPAPPFSPMPTEDEVAAHTAALGSAPNATKKANVILLIAAAIFGAVSVCGALFAPLFAAAPFCIALAIAYGISYAGAKRSHVMAESKAAETKARVNEFIRITLGNEVAIAPKAALEKISESLRQYKEALIAYDTKAQMLKAQAAEEEGRIVALDRGISDYLAHFDSESVRTPQDLRRLSAEHDMCRKMVENKLSAIENYKIQQGIDENESETVPPDVAGIDEQIRLTEQAISECERNAEGCRIRLDKVSCAKAECVQLKEAIAEMSEKIASYNESLQAVTYAKELLEKAKDNLNVRYLSKTKESFDKYVGLIHGDGDEFSIDTKFNVMKTDMGKSRVSESYSRGMRELYALCMRFALTDSLYGEDYPPIILDDPFISFDDNHVESGLSLLVRLAEDRQIIYLTCSHSRVS